MTFDFFAIDRDALFSYSLIINLHGLLILRRVENKEFLYFFQKKLMKELIFQYFFSIVK